MKSREVNYCHFKLGIFLLGIVIHIVPHIVLFVLELKGEKCLSPGVIDQLGQHIEDPFSRIK